MKRTLAIAAAVGLSVAGLTAAGAPTEATTSGVNGSIVFAADAGLGFQLFAMEPNGLGFR